MQQDKIFSQNNRFRMLYPLLFVVGVFIWQAMTGFNLRDEGYHWYGAKSMIAVGLLWLICLWMFPRHKSFANITNLQMGALLSLFVAKMTQRRALLVQFFPRVQATLNGNGDGRISVHFWPGAHATVDVRVPVWEIFLMCPQTPAFESHDRARMQARRLFSVIWSDAPMDRNDALRYSQTHHVLFAYTTAAYQDVPALSTQIFRVLKVKATQP
jgi:hypothetical protein